MSGLSAARVAKLRALTWEAALRHLARYGSVLPADAQALAAADALACPRAASRCPHLLAAIGPLVAASVSAQATGPDVTAVDERITRTASSERGRPRWWITAAEAARITGLTAAGVRAACRRGDLSATRHETGWRIPVSAVIEHGRQHGRQAPQAL